jgi:hypothetical protein
MSTARSATILELSDKSCKTRAAVPVATVRLRAVLDWLHIDADRQKKLDEVFVFSRA